MPSCRGAGGWTRDQLRQWGVPPKGWKWAMISHFRTVRIAQERERYLKERDARLGQQQFMTLNELIEHEQQTRRRPKAVALKKYQRV
jgi:hypothetical protein